MKIKKLCTVVLLLFLSFYAKAQIWQAYRGVWLKGYDNATQAPIPPAGYSALTYFADSLGTYVYDWDSLAWLRIPGAGGGGGGGLTTASNMLSVAPGGNVISGGTATHNTFNHLGNFGVQWSSPTTKLALPPPSTNFPFTQSAYFTVGDTTSSPTTNFAQLYLENVPVDVPTARLTAGNGSNQATVRLVPNSGIMQAGATNHVTVGATQSVLRNGNVQWALSGANQRADLSSFVGSSSGLRFSIGSTTESVIQTIPSGDNLRFTTNNGNIVLDDPVILQQEPAQLDTATWFLVRRHSDGAIVQRKVSGGGGGLATADNGLIVNPAGNVRIGTSAQPGEVLDEGAVFATDSLNVGVSHFWFMPDSVQIGNLTDLGEGAEPAYVLIKDGTVSAHTSTTEVRLQKGGTNTMQVLFGGIPQYSFGSSLFRYGSSGLTPATRLFEIANGNLLQFTSRIGDFMAFQTQDGATGTESTGSILIRTGSVTSGTGDVGDIEIRLGAQAGSGSGGTLQLDPNSGYLTIVNIPTSDPCGSAPSGTVWSDSGTLKVCP